MNNKPNVFEAVEFGAKEKRIYLAKIDYPSLINLVKIRSLSTNREVDPDRAKEMVEYIKEEGTFFPPLVLSTVAKNTVLYSKDQMKISINVKEALSNHLTVIDGQHRYKSIEYLMQEYPEADYTRRFQSVFLIDNINEFERRKIFMDINDNAKRVSSGTKERFKISISNYISLKVLNNNQDLLKIISMDDNQTNKIEQYPFKFITKANGELLKRIEKDFDQKISLEDIDAILPLFYFMWNKFLELITTNKERYIVTLEIFLQEFCINFKPIFEKYVYNEENNFTSSINFREFEDDFSAKIESIIITDDIDKEIRNLPNITEKRRMLKEFFSKES